MPDAHHPAHAEAGSPTRACLPSWINTIHRERRNLERLLQDSPSLKAHLPTLFLEAYEDGRYDAAKETELEIGVFPERPVFSLEQVRAPDFMTADRQGDRSVEAPHGTPEA